LKKNILEVDIVEQMDQLEYFKVEKDFGVNERPISGDAAFYSFSRYFIVGSQALQGGK